MPSELAKEQKEKRKEISGRDDVAFNVVKYTTTSTAKGGEKS